MKHLAEYLTPEEASERLRTLAESLGGAEVAAVRNLDYIHSPIEFYPLAPRVSGPLDRIAAFVVDMDGTSTTTEPLALHALEYMVRRITNRRAREDWPGLDPVVDYPHVIGNSNYRHTEFLLNRYGREVDPGAFRAAFIEAVLWTLADMDDPHRLRDVRLNARNAGLGPMLDDPAFRCAAEGGGVDMESAEESAAPFVQRFADLFETPSPAAHIAAALDIYYYRYHAILRLVEHGEGERLSRELLGQAGRRLVEPMAGYGVFLALAKGLLGEEAGNMAPSLLATLPEASAARSLPEGEARARLERLGRHFEESPAEVGLVTASIAYEAHATMRAIFDVMRDEVESWPVSPERRKACRTLFSDYRAAFDGFVTASDASEARLKPHRDLYAIALFQMSIPKDDYARCIGLEDSEPGILSLRAAGVGCAVALPNHDTQRQNYQAAAHVIQGGLPELILDHNLLLA